jgi:hypothetical protein
MASCEIPYKRGGPKAPTAIHGPSGPIFYSIDKANVIANYLENQSSPHKFCDLDHERRVEAKVQAVLNTVDEAPPGKFRPSDVSKEIRSLKLGNACGLDGTYTALLKKLIMERTKKKRPPHCCRCLATASERTPKKRQPHCWAAA